MKLRAKNKTSQQLQSANIPNVRVHNMWLRIRKSVKEQESHQKTSRQHLYHASQPLGYEIIQNN